jgi:FixJ family two-component response regulator
VKYQQSSDATVFIVDDDKAIRHAMGLLLRSVGLTHCIFHSATEFLENFCGEGHGCLVLDIRMPGMSGLELQDKLKEVGSMLPIIFVTGFADVPMAVTAMQKGAFDFIEKPFRDQDLLDRINNALRADSTHRVDDENARQIRLRVRRLTNREQDVMNLVVAGKPNKIIAYDLAVSQRTVEIHRARVMEKMEAKSLADLVRMFTAISN